MRRLSLMTAVVYVKALSTGICGDEGYGLARVWPKNCIMFGPQRNQFRGVGAQYIVDEAERYCCGVVAGEDEHHKERDDLGDEVFVETEAGFGVCELLTLCGSITLCGQGEDGFDIRSFTGTDFTSSLRSDLLFDEGKKILANDPVPPPHQRRTQRVEELRQRFWGILRA